MYSISNRRVRPENFIRIFSNYFLISITRSPYSAAFFYDFNYAN